MIRTDGTPLRRERDRWLLATGIVLLLLTALLGYSRVTFETNDDCSIIAIAAGYLTGAPNPSTLSTSYGYGLLLAALYRLAGGVAWHTVLMLLFNALSLTVLLQSCFTLCVRLGARYRYGLLGFVAIFGGVLLPFTVQLQFTAVAGCAFTSALLLVTVLPDPLSKRTLVFRVALALLCALFSFALRPNVALMLLPFAAIAALARLMRRAEGWRVCAAFCACLLLGYGALYSLDRSLYDMEPGGSAFQAFDRETTRLLDYNTQPLPEADRHAAAQAAGWSDGLLDMARNWFFLDGRINTTQLAALNNAMETGREVLSLPDRVAAVLKSTASILRRYPMFQWNFLGFGTAAALALWLCRKQKKPWLAAEIVALFTYTLALIAYFYGVRNRFPLRVAFSVAYPLYALLLPAFAEALHGQPTNGQPKPTVRAGARCRAGAALLVLLLLGGGLSLSVNNGDGLSPRSAGASRSAALADAVNTYAADRPGNLYVTDYCEDFDPFATYAPGSLQNLVYWGSGVSRSPADLARFRALGYNRFGVEQFFDDNVYILLVGGDPTLQRLRAYLAADYGLTALVPVDQTEDFTVYRAVHNES